LVSSITPEQIRVFGIFERLPSFVTEPFQAWTLQQTAAMWPLLREEFERAGIDIDAAEFGADKGV
jgi:hypothetical protein